MLLEFGRSERVGVRGWFGGKKREGSGLADVRVTCRAMKAIQAVKELADSFPLRNVHPPAESEAATNPAEAKVEDEKTSGFVANTVSSSPSNLEQPDPSEHLVRLRSRFRMAGSLLGTSSAEVLGTGKPGALNF